MLIPLIIILGTGFCVLIFFLYRMFLAPRKVLGLDKMLKAGKVKQVTRAAKQIIAKEPRNVDAHYILGQAYQLEKKAELALMEFKTVNQIGEFTQLCREVPFRTQMGELYWKFNQVEEALKEYLLLIKEQPGEFGHYFKVGQLFELREQPDRAIQYHMKAVELNKDFAPAHYQLGLLFSKQKKVLEARRELEIAVKLEPGNSGAWYHLGRLLKESRDFAAALSAFDKAQRDPVLKAKVLIERGTCYMNMSNYDQAIPELERGLKLSKDDADAAVLYGRYFLSICYEKTGKLDDAVAEWEKIYARKPTFRDVAEKLSHYQEMRTDDGMKDYLTSGKEEFLEVCGQVARASGLEVISVKGIEDGCEILASIVDKKRLGTKKMVKLVRFYRSAEPLNDAVVRSLAEAMKRDNAVRGMIVTSSGFSRKAVEFSESRPIDLVSKDRLTELLKQADRR